MSGEVRRAGRLPGGLATRLIALALGQLVLIAGAAALIAFLTRPPAPRDLSGLLEGVASRLEGVADQRALGRTLDSLGRESQLELSLYARDGSLRASMIEPPLQSGPPVELGPPPFVHGGPPLPPPVTRTLRDGSLLVGRPARPPLQLVGPLLTLLTGVLVLGVGGVLTARWILSPLGSLRDAAKRIAEGDLGARVALGREDELGEVAQAFDHMAGRIEAARRSERELLANVSHELRTPLSRLRVALELAEEGHEVGKTALKDAAVDLAELEAIIDSILAAVRMERDPEGLDHGLPASSLRDVAVSELLTTIASRFRSRHPTRPLTLALPDAPERVLVDPLLLRRVVENLLENAHKYSPDGAAEITLSARRLDGGRGVEIAVQDRGMGIAADDLPRVFEPFFRGERSRSRGAGGVGLGLTLCKRIVTAHGGSISVESELAEGTTVRVRLPVRRDARSTDTDGHEPAKSG